MTSHHCPNCDTDMRLVNQTKDFRVGKRTATVEAEFFYCEACDEVLYTPDQMDQAQRLVAAELRRQEGLLTPDEIKAIRLGKALSQSAFEVLLGVGPKTVVRWERGTVFQNRGIDTLMRLVHEVPGVFEHLAASRGIPHGLAAVARRPDARNLLAFNPQRPRSRRGRKSEGAFGQSLQRTRVRPSREAELPVISKENLQ